MVNGVQILGTPFNRLHQLYCRKRRTRQLLYVIHLQVWNFCLPGKYTPSTMVNRVQILGTLFNRVHQLYSTKRSARELLNVIALQV